MNLSEFKTHLGQHADKPLQFILPTGSKIPLHAHITDVARIDKHFIDCGARIRSESLCRLQLWFADDTEHRISAGKLLKVLGKAEPVLGADDLEVDLEYEAPFIAQFPITKIEPADAALVIHLGIRHTACLAPDICIPATPAKKAVQYKGLPTLEPAKCC